MKHLVLVYLLGTVLTLSASDAFGWGAVTGPRGGAAYRGPMGGAAVRGPYGGAVARGPAGGVAARGPYGGAAYRGPYGGTAVRGAYGGTTVVTGGAYRPYYGAGAVAAGVAVGRLRVRRRLRPIATTRLTATQHPIITRRLGRVGLKLEAGVS